MEDAVERTIELQKEIKAYKDNYTELLKRIGIGE